MHRLPGGANHAEQELAAPVGVRAIDAEAVDLRYRSNGMHRGAQELLDGQELARRGAGDPAIGDGMAVPPANQVMGLIVEGFAFELVRERERWLPAALVMVR